jgi:hypothetical protein
LLYLSSFPIKSSITSFILCFFCIYFKCVKDGDKHIRCHIQC